MAIVKRNPLRELFAAIPHSVIDSPAFSDLNGQAVRLLLIMARQGRGTNNGLIQATFKFSKPRGIGSEHTLKDAISELIAHGFIARTRSRGTANGKNIWAYYALTWLPLCSDQLKRTHNLHFDNFRMCSFRS